LLRQFFPNKRILVMTHNRPLINDLERRYRQLSNGDRQVEWRTFHGWCHKYWPDGEPRRSLIGRRDRLELVRRVWHTHLANTALSPEVLQDEIDGLKDRLITTREGYQTADRSGRGFRLTESLRGRVFDAIHAYQDALQERNLLDYGDVPRRVWRGILEGRSQLPQYDFILIDEAQFFAPIWFEILKQTLTPQHGQLFLVADPTQGFLKRRQSWLACGLDVRGRSHRLDQCYRTTRAILQFATRYYQMRLPDDSDAHMAADTQTADEGLLPQIVGVASEQDELTRVVNEIKALVQAGVPLAHMLVIHAEWQGAERLRERLQNEFGAAQAIDPRNRVIGTPLRVCSLDSATGLESPIVFLVGTNRLHEAEASVRLSEDERAERVRDNTRRLYMAMTRAGQRLVLTYVGTPPEAFRLP
jgi:superfamily I DNA/RNA helicase